MRNHFGAAIVSIIKDSAFEPGFPFTPSRFKGIPQTGSTLAVSPQKARLLPDAGVNSEQIHERTAQLLGKASAELPRRCHASPGRNRPLQLKLLPLESFAWGGRTAMPQPRTRGEMTLIWVLQGRLKLDFPRQSHRLGPCSLFFIPAGTAFATLPLAGSVGQVLLITPHLARDLPQPFPDRPTEGRVDHDDPALRQLFHDLMAEARTDGTHARAARECHLALLALRLQRLEPAARHIERPTPENPDLPLADRFLALARTRIADNSTIADFAHDLGATTAELDAACRHKHGKRALDLINDIRLRRAVQMMRETQEDPARIARMLGYSSLAHLSRAFVSATGRLPRQFRD